MMSIFSMTPYKRNDVSNYFDDFEKAFFGNMPELASFRTDVLDKGDSYVLEAELPGFKKEDIDISLEGDVLTVSSKLEQLNGKSGTLSQVVTLNPNGEVVADALITFVCIDLKTQKALPLEGELRAKLDQMNLR